MSRKVSTKLLVVLCSCSLLLAGIAGSAGAASTTATSNGTIKNEGACDPKLPAVPVAALIVGETPALDLQDQADALVTSAKAFNKKYNGIGGHCYEVDVCDVEFDPNIAADCARKLADSDAVATLNDTTPQGAPEVVEILKTAGCPPRRCEPGHPRAGRPELVRDRRGRRRHHLHDGAAAHP